MFNATSVEARDWSEAGLSSRSERTIWSVCRSKEVGEVDSRARGRGDIESSSTDTHTLIAYDGMGLELGDAGGRLNGS